MFYIDEADFEGRPSLREGPEEMANSVKVGTR
jgi:hypothetical protein